MPAKHSYQVIQLKQAVLLMGNSWLVSQLTPRFQSQNIQVYLTPISIPDDVDLDYVFLEGEGVNDNLPKLDSLISLHSSRVIHLSHTSQTPPSDLPKTAISVKYADCFGEGFTMAPQLTNLLNLATQSHSISLKDDGLDNYHLLLDTDLLDGIFLALTNSSFPQDTIFANPSGISLLSLAYLIRSQLAKEVVLNFDDPSTWQDQGLNWEVISTANKKINWKPTSDIHSQLITYISTYSPDIVPTSPVEKQQDSTKPHLSRLSDLTDPPSAHPTAPLPAPSSNNLEFVPINHGNKRFRIPQFHLPKLSTPRPVSIVVGGISIAIFLYILVLITSLTLTYLSTKSFKSTLSSSSLPPQRSLTVARVPAIFIEANLVALSSLPYLQQSSVITQLTSLATYYRHGLDSLLLAHDLADTSSSLLGYVLGAGEGDVVSLINQTRLLSSELYESLSLLSGSLPATPPPLIPEEMGDSYQNLRQTLQLLRSSTLTAKSLLATAPDLLGVGDRRKYLILFQNNMELRPTGGFIGSFALISFENGKLYDMPIYDVYSADGQLKGHVEPPEEIKKYLGEANWYMRDSNWDPDFPTSARRAEWFLDKTLDMQVNGTIAVNVDTLAGLLEAIGPITIPDYDEEITSDNIFERAEYHSEVNFFPGSSQKKEFLSSIADTLFNHLTDLSVTQALPVAQALAKGIDEKNTLLAIDSDITNHTFSTLGWNGELRSPSCPNLGQECYLDYAMLVDANLGVNKANYFLRRSLTHVVTLDKNLSPSHTLTAKYQNTSTSNSWPAGAYKTYSRLYLPSDSIFDSLTIAGKRVDQENITLSAQHGRLVIGYLLNVPINSTVEIKLSYHRAQSLSKNSPTYSFYWQKQPGSQADPLTIYLNHPLYLEPDIISPSAKLLDQQLEFSLTNVTDRRITVKFQ